MILNKTDMVKTMQIISPPQLLLVLNNVVLAFAVLAENEIKNTTAEFVPSTEKIIIHNKIRDY